MLIERLPYAQFIARYDRPAALFFLDPPYWDNEDDYGEGGFSNVNTTLVGFDALNQDWYVQGGLLAGYLINRTTMASFHSGYEISKWSTDLSNEDIDVGAWVIGGGLDTMVSENVSIGLKLDYLIPQSVEAAGFDVTNFVEDSEGLRAQFKLTYRR